MCDRYVKSPSLVSSATVSEAEEERMLDGGAYMSSGASMEETAPLLWSAPMSAPMSAHGPSSHLHKVCSSPTLGPHAASCPPQTTLSHSQQVAGIIAMRPRAGSFSRESIEKGEPCQRKPYHYGATEHHSLAEVDTQEVANYHRFKYYTKLRGPAPQQDNALLIPDHVIPESFFFPFTDADQQHKHSSLVTIFALWNTMMGTSLLSMPWAIRQTGLALGLSVMLFMGLLCFYTAYRTLTVFNTHCGPLVAEFGQLCQMLLGRKAELLAIIFSILTLMGACSVYWILLSNFLYNIVDYVYSRVEYVPATVIVNASFPNVVCIANYTGGSVNTTSVGDSLTTDLYHQIWNLGLTVPLFLVLVFFPLINMKSAAFFTKFNSFGTLSVIYLVVFVCVKAARFGWNVEFSDSESPAYISLAQPGNIATMTGTLSMALFIHNCLITIIKNNKDQKKNARDLSVAFFLVVMTYFGIGTTFYLSFPLSKICIQDNLLNNFLNSDVMSVIARACLFFQMTTVFPMLMYIMRVQFFCAIGMPLYPGWVPVLLFNSVLVSVYVLLAIYLPRIGTIIRFSGAICGLVYIYTLPPLLHVRSLKTRGALTWTSLVLHSLIGLFGVANLVLQFVAKP